MTLPGVSCIMPTRDRRPFVAQALRYFLRQDYPGAELIVVDDGYDEVADLMPDDSRVRYVRLPSVHTIGAKRNIACAQATGELIAHWDDDDWSAPDRLRRQVDALVAAGVDACGVSELLHYRPKEADGWLYCGGRHVAGCSIVYRRATWSENAFPEVSVGEDSAFIGRLAPDRVLALADRRLLIAVRHERNTTTLPLGTPEWQRASLDEIGALLGDDRPFYTRLRGGTAPPAAVRPPAASIGVAAPFDIASGYGSSAEYLVLSLARAGVDVHAIPLSLNPPGLTDELLERTRRPPQPGEPTIYYCWPRPDLAPFCDGRDLFIATMYEGDRLPPAWVPALERTRAVIVPSSFVARACRESGVTRPVAVVALGADPDVYHWQPRQQREGLVTLIVGPVDERKHTRLAIAAWKEAFAGDAAARLVIKAQYAYHNYTPDDERITYVDRIDRERGIAGFYRDADVLLALGSEGFGLPLVEGMCTGLPVIALDAEGQADVCRDARGLVLPVPAAGREPHDAHAHRSVPDFDATVRHLRWVGAHRDEARALGRAASAWATEHRNAWSIGPGVLDVLAGTSRRRVSPPARRTLWVPSAGAACGVAEFTARLRRNVPSARLVATEPAIEPHAMVHVQHEPTLFDERAFERFLVRARARGMAVAVTQHTLRGYPSPWEQHASALVAPTRAGATQLRTRNPELPVVHIPLGCETWSLPRKRRRGRTIGCFGFPGRHKGLERLGGALRKLGGCDIVLFSHRFDPASTWPAELPLRVETGWLALPEVAGRLAAEADVLVFHYDEIPHASASSAVLLGLSTGVPVLASATSWFADLGAAVHRAEPDALAAELERLLEDDDLRATTTASAREYCAEHSWSRIAARHVDLWNSIEAV